VQGAVWSQEGLGVGTVSFSGALFRLGTEAVPKCRDGEGKSLTVVGFEGVRFLLWGEPGRSYGSFFSRFGTGAEKPVASSPEGSQGPVSFLGALLRPGIEEVPKCWDRK
jgi:hypothetical protein